MSDLDSIHVALREIQRSVGRIEGTVGEMKGSLDAREREHDQLAERVNKVENRQAYANGKSAVYGAAAGGVLGFLSKFLFPPGGA